MVCLQQYTCTVLTAKRLKISDARAAGGRAREAVRAARGGDLESPKRHRECAFRGMAEVWTRAATEPVTYSFSPMRAPAGDAGPPLTAHKRRADARLRRATTDAWCDPERAKKDLLATGTYYAASRDSQGLANAYMAHAQTHSAIAYMAAVDGHRAPELSLPATQTSRKEYSFAADIYTHLLEDRNVAQYSVARQRSVHRASIGQRMRPAPIFLDAGDARAAVMGGGVGLRCR